MSSSQGGKLRRSLLTGSAASYLPWRAARSDAWAPPPAPPTPSPLIAYPRATRFAQPSLNAHSSTPTSPHRPPPGVAALCWAEGCSVDGCRRELAGTDEPSSHVPNSHWEVAGLRDRRRIAGEPGRARRGPSQCPARGDPLVDLGRQQPDDEDRGDLQRPTGECATPRRRHRLCADYRGGRRGARLGGTGRGAPDQRRRRGDRRRRHPRGGAVDDDNRSRAGYGARSLTLRRAWPHPRGGGHLERAARRGVERLRDRHLPRRPALGVPHLRPAVRALQRVSRGRRRAGQPARHLLTRNRDRGRRPDPPDALGDRPDRLEVRLEKGQCPGEWWHVDYLGG